jgi:hypothetical protein
VATLSAADLEHFADRGYVRVRAAFDDAAAAAMRDVVWDALAAVGVDRDDPSTWTDESPSHLQSLKKAGAFRAVGSARTLGAIDDVLGAGAWNRPRDWGAFFVLFPTRREWSVPHRTWHLDAPYDDPLTPPAGLKVHAMFGDVAPWAGGMTIVAGSHRVVSDYIGREPPQPDESAAAVRKRVMRSHPWLEALETKTPGDAPSRITRFFDNDEDVFGVRVRVVELTADAGDVILMHPLLLHTRPTNAGRYPRFLLNKDLRTGAQLVPGAR